MSKGEVYQVLLESRHYWRYYLLSLVFMIVSVGSDLWIPLVIREIIDVTFIRQDYSRLTFSLSFMLLLAILSGGMNFLSRITSEVAAQKTVKDLRNKVFDALVKQDVDFFSNQETGQLLTRGTADIEAIRRFLSMGARISMQGLLVYFGLLILLWNIDRVLLSLVVFLGLPLVFIMAMFGKKIGPLFIKQRKLFGDVSTVAQETIEGITVVKAYHGESIQKNIFMSQNHRYFDLQLQIAKERATYIPLVFLTIGIITGLVIYLGGVTVINDVISIGTFVAFITYLVMLALPVRFVAWFLALYEQAKAGSARVYEILNREPRIIETDSIPIPTSLRGEIVFDNVFFSYSVSTKPVLRGLNLTIKSGEKVAILGSIGSGKTTLVNLIPRFYDPDKGRVLIDGVDVKRYRLRDLRKKIAFVGQDTFLFSTSLKENIAFAKPSASMDEIIRASKIAQLHDFVETLPEGYDTLVGERGVRLSGGQRQRVAIARAILADASILILDDTTSSIDSQTEQELHKALAKVVEGRTVIIITQRLGNLRLADRILLLKDGQIVEEGTHSELLAKKGLYWDIYASRTIDPKLAEAILENMTRERR